MLEKEESAMKNKKDTKTPSKDITVDSEIKKMSYQEKKEYDSLDGTLEKLDKRKNDITDKLQNPKLNSEELMALSAEFGEVEKEIEIKTDRWLTLSELL